MKKLIAAAIVAASLAAPASAFIYRGTNTAPSAGASGWMSANAGAGGYVIQWDQSNDGTKVISTDTYGGHIWSDALNKWVQLFDARTLPVGATSNGAAGGNASYQIGISTTNSSKMYATYSDGCIYARQFLATTNKGANWTVKSGFTDTGCAGGQYFYREGGPFMQVDPNNDAVVFFGSVSGLYRTLDSGTTFSIIPTGSVPVPTNAAFAAVAFDPSSAHNCNGSGGAGTNTCGIYVASYGNGVYHTTDGGNTWSATSGGPTDVWQIKVSISGTVWATQDANLGSGRLYRYLVGGTPSGWSTTTVNQLGTIAMDPSNANRVVNGGAGILYTSLNADVSTAASMVFTPFGTATCPQNAAFGSVAQRSSSDIPWLQNTNECFMSPGALFFDKGLPSSQSRIWFTEGIGVWYYDYNGANNAPTTLLTWVDQSRGIENLVGNEVVYSPTAGLIFCNWDRPDFILSEANPPIYPSNHGSTYLVGISQCQSVDYASKSGDTSTIVSVNSGFSETSGYSLDGGTTWVLFSSLPQVNGFNANFGGSISAVDTTHFMWFGNDNGDPFVGVRSGSTVTWTQKCIAAANAIVIPCSVSSTTAVQFARSSINTVIGTGSKSFTVGTGLTFTGGATFTASDGAGNTMTGTVTSYTSGTGALVLNIGSVTGSGTLSSPMVFPGTGNISLTLSGSYTCTNSGFGSIPAGAGYSALSSGPGPHFNIVSCSGTTLIGTPTQLFGGQGTGSSWMITPESGWGNNHQFHARVTASDRVDANTYYAYNYGPTNNANNQAGMYISTDAGATWTQTFIGLLDAFGGQNAQMRAVPQSGSTSTAGHVIWTKGSSAGTGGSCCSASGKFQDSVDHGHTWTNRLSVCGISTFGFGKAAAGKNYPVIYLVGYYNATANCGGGSGTDVFGIWKSEDSTAGLNGTITAVSGANADGTNCGSGFPNCNIDWMQSIYGNLNTYDQIWVATSGGGAVVKQP